MGALGDCELIRYDFLGQPINTVTTFAFILAGVWLLQAGRAKWVGVALVATGLGSFVFHSPMPPWSEWAHDVSLAWLIVAVGGLGTRWERWSRWPALLVLSLLFALVSSLADPVAIALTVLVVALILLRRPTWGQVAPMWTLGLVALVGRLGATGWPLCDPSSPLQTHAIWHVGAAVAVTWWAYVATHPGESSLSQT